MVPVETTISFVHTTQFTVQSNRYPLRDMPKTNRNLSMSLRESKIRKQKLNFRRLLGISSISAGKLSRYLLNEPKLIFVTTG